MSTKTDDANDKITTLTSLNTGNPSFKNALRMTDTDGDGVNDDVDIDDDNDGILDTNETLGCSSPNFSFFSFEDDFGTGTTRTSTPFINSGVYSFRASGNTGDGEYCVIDGTNPQAATFGNWISFSDNTGNTDGKMLVVNAATTPGEFYRRTLTGILTNNDVTLSFFVRDICPSCPINPNLNFEIQDPSNNVLTSANTGTITLAGWQQFTLTANSGANSEIQFVIRNNSPGGSGNDLAIDDITVQQFICDSDGDGIIDSLDLDSDNDGIPDNIEAQTTTGYVAPTGTDTDNDGLDDAYDATPNGSSDGAGSLGLTPENTDGTGDPDYLDLDSDGDGTFDIVESGSGLTDTAGGADGRTDGTVGTNGLDNTLDGAADDYTDVNGSFDDTQADNFTDADGDVNTGGDVDYRDDLVGVDTDGDGVLNPVDLDDDNDGILDTIECPASLIDTDSDGIADCFDLDSDNDGIPDNIEAQTTAGYIAPNNDSPATLIANNGVNSAYLGGLTVENTDATDDSDYLDLDSDNDGTFDIVESGSGLTDTAGGADGRTDGTVGANGLDNTLDGAADDYTDVNGAFDDTQTDNFTDTDGDANSSIGDVDYRDTVINADTDGDGIPDSVDIDSDNDGILDTEENSICTTIPTSSSGPIIDSNGTSQPLSLINDNDFTADLGVDLNGVGEYIIIDLGSNIPTGVGLRFTLWQTRSDLIKTIRFAQLPNTTVNLGGGTNLQTVEQTAIATNTNVTTFDYTLTEPTRYIQIDMPVRTGGRIEIVEAQILSYLSCDTDGDDIPDNTDLDSDNDGIPDNIEAQTTLGYVAPTGTDSDNDGLDDAYDTTPNGNIDGTGSVGLTAVNTDGTGDPDYLDLDSDNDGIFDIVESGSGLTDTAGGADGRTDGTVGTNGLDNTLDGAADDFTDVNGSFDNTQTDNFTDVDRDAANIGGNVDYRDTTIEFDTDNDGILDNVDIDSDNDGILDAIECPALPLQFSGLSTTANSYDLSSVNITQTFGNTGTVDASNTDNNGNIAFTGNGAFVDINASTASTFLILPATNAGRSFDDGDLWTLTAAGVNFVVNDPSSELLIVSNVIGTITFRSLLLNDPTGWSIEVPNATDLRATMTTGNSFSDIRIELLGDTDLDGIIDCRDLDSDNDGIPDNIEAQTTAGYMAPNNDSPATLLANNGVNSAYLGGLTPENTDGTGDPDYLDLDSDDDGTFDIVESGSGLTDTAGGADGRTDGTVGINGLDNTLDGAADDYTDVNGAFDNTQTDNFTDTDGTGDVDYREPLDTDNDGVIDTIDLDDDNDGILDSVENGGNDPNGDNDGDGIVNLLDTTDDTATTGPGDGSTTNYTDANGDGTPDVFDLDTDSDGIADYLDLDTDNDGIPDSIEAQTTAGYIAPNNDSPATLLANNGVNSAYLGGLTPQNTDGTGDPDYLDLDSDDDGVFDIVESGSGLTDTAGGADGRTDGTVGTNGLDNTLDGAADDYTDVNGAFDDTQTDNFTDTDGTGDVDYREPLDTDNDGVIDTIDLDDDNDGILDSVENGGNDPNGDNDGDGIVNLLDTTDDTATTGPGDGSTTNYTDANGDGTPDVFDLDTDSDGIADYLDLDTDNDGIPDSIEAQTTTGYIAPNNDSPATLLANNGVNSAYLGGLTPQNTDGTGDPDYLDLDSDDDGVFDIVESGSGLTDTAGGADGRTDGTVGTNGLDNTLDGAADDYTDVNGAFDDTQTDNFTDTDGDVAIPGGDLDYRDDLVGVDTDGDGVLNSVDLDDDNDGILDAIECPSPNVVFTYTGSDQNYTIPAGVTSITAKVWGAGGRADTRQARGVGGAGGYTEVTIPVASLTSNNLILTVGEGGSDSNGGPTYGNGGSGLNNFGSGGGMSAISHITLATPGSVTLADLIAIAGGGGTMPTSTTSGTNAGEGGGTTGGDATDTNLAVNGGGGTQSAGGTSNGNPGAFLIGGAAVTNGGAGGGGYYGGGSGAQNGIDEGGGGGGSGYISPLATLSQTLRGAVRTPPMQADADYVAGVGLGGNTNSGDGGNGLIILILNFDSDSDGIADCFDLDSDNDGIPDNIEAQTTAGYIAPNNDSPATLIANNGVNSAYLGGLTPENTDATDDSDYLDLDSDNDGIFDIVESGSGLTDTAGGADGRTDGTVGTNGLDNTLDGAADDYTDVNGAFDDTQTDNFTDTDGDVNSSIGDVDYRDTVINADTDGDGIPDSVDIDSDNDGILDTEENGICTTIPTSSSGPIIDNVGAGGALSLINDNDFTADLGVELNGVGEYIIIDLGSNIPTGVNLRFTLWRNTNNNTRSIRFAQLPNTTVNLGGGTNLQTVEQTAIATNTSVTTFDYTLTEPTRYIQIDMPVRTGGRIEIVEAQILSHLSCDTDGDGDGIPDNTDLDSDNDGIPDNIEAQTTLGYVAPTGTDSDNDGLDDAYDTTPNGNIDGTGSVGLTVENTDGTGDPDYLDLDSDGDGTFDIVESGSGLIDTAGGADGRTDGTVGTNGLDNTLDGAADDFTDVNGAFDDTQTDNFTDTDGDANFSIGDVDYRDTVINADTDGDGIPDSVDIDSDNDGILDTEENGICTTIPTSSSGPIIDNVGAGGALSLINDNDFTADLGVDLNGVGEYIIIDLGSNIPTGVNLRFTLWRNTNNNTRSIRFAQLPNTTVNLGGGTNLQTVEQTAIATNTSVTTFDYTLTEPTRYIQIDMPVRTGGRIEIVEAQILSYLSCDTDGDGDGIPDNTDLDSDNDGIPDNIEAQTTLGYVAPTGTDSDNDGLDDAYDTTPNGNIDGTGSVGLTVENTDGTGDPDYLDLDSDGDGTFDIVESGSGLIDTAGGADGRTDGTVGTNGLDNTLDGAADDFTDVNGSFDDTQADNFTDADGDVNTGGDVDYRDRPTPAGVNNNLLLWLRADKGGTSWTDQTLNGVTTTQSGTVNTGSLLNFNATNSFAGAGHYDTNLDINFSTRPDLGVIAVFVPTATSSGNIWGEANSTEDRFFTHNASNLEVSDGSAPTRAVIASTINTPLLATSIFDQGVGSGSTVLIDGQQTLSFTSTNSTNANTLEIGALGDNTGQFNGQIAEIIVYDQLLTTGTDRQEIESYLSLKYGLTLSSDTDGDATSFEAGEGDYLASDATIWWDASANSTYHNNVAGIARDDESCLIQRQSKSVNPDAILAIGLDDDTNGLEGSNAANTNNFSVNQSALVWGHDNADINGGPGSAAETEFNPLQVLSRLNREWRVQETGTVGTVTIEFDVSGLLGPDNAVGTSDESQIILLVDADGDFSSGASIVAQSFVVNNDGNVVFRADLTNGTFFTLGSGEEGALPITLLSLTANTKEDHILLEWTTANETNNSLYRIERSSNASDFESIGFKDGSSTTSTTNNYSFRDEAPLAGNNYYRLVDIDNQGNENYSQLIRAEYVQQLFVPLPYPNPVKPGGLISIKLPDITTLNQVKVFNLSGINIPIRVFEKGNTLSIQLPNIAEGIYLIQINIEGKVISKKIKVTL